MSRPHYLISPRSLATATALFLSLPMLGDPQQDQPLPLDAEKFAPLDGVGDIVAKAMQPASYIIGKPLVLFSLISEVATRLVKESKPLDGDFARTVDKEFWNLLR